LNKPLRGVLGLLAVLVLIAAGIAVAAFEVDPDSLKPQIAAGLARATGLDVSIAGHVRLARSLPIRLVAEDISFASRPGSDWHGAGTAETLDARIEAGDLLRGRLSIAHLALSKPAIVLDVGARAMPPAPAPTPGAASPPDTAGAAPAGVAVADGKPRRGRFDIRALDLRDGVLTLRLPPAHPGADAPAMRIEIADVAATARPADSAISLSGTLRIGGAPFTLAAETGAIARLQDRADIAPWPFQATLTAAPDGGGSANMRLALSGSLSGPHGARETTLVVEGAVPDATALAPLAAPFGWQAPKLCDVTLIGRIAAGAGSPPVVSLLKLHAGRSDLSALLPGLLIASADLAIDGPDAPPRMDLHGTLRGMALRMAGSVGATNWLPGEDKPLPLDMAVALDAAQATAKGSIAHPGALDGLDLVVQGTLPDLEAISPLARTGLPKLRDLTFEGHLSGGPAAGLTLTDARLRSGDSDLAGDAALRFGPKPKIDAMLASTRLDLDALFPAAAAPPPSAAPAPAAPPVPAASAPLETPRSGVMDRNLPIAALRLGDADVTFKFAQVQVQGVNLRDVAGHAVLTGDRLTVDPLAADTPAGRIEGSLAADAAPPDPTFAITLRAPAVAIRPALAAFGLPGDVTGAAQVDADLHAAGATPRALLADVDGRVGLSISDGDIDNRLLAALAGDVLRAARLPVEAIAGGRSHLRCLALRLNAANGSASIGALVLDSSKLLLQGSGAVALADQGLALRLRPVVRLGAGPGLAVPVRVGGTLHAPKAALDVAGALDALTTAALQGGRGVSPSGIDRNGDLCPPALAAARNGAPGPVPKPASSGVAAEVLPGDAAAAGGTSSAGGAGSPNGVAPAVRKNPASLLRALMR
jgi:AsmA protein